MLIRTRWPFVTIYVGILIIPYRIKYRWMEILPWLDTYNAMWGLYSVLATKKLIDHADSMFIHIWSSLATLTLRHAAATYSRGPQGMKAWSSCWIGSCQQSGPSHPRSGGIVPFGMVARNTHGNTRRCYNKLPVWLRLPSFPWCLKDTYHYHLGGGGISWLFLLITCQILAHDPWKIHIITI